MGRMRNIASTAAAAIALAVPSIAPAQALSDQWQFGASIYGWLPSISGKTAFPPTGGSDVNVDASKIISNLKFAFLGGLTAQKGQWGGFTDIVYLNVGGSKSGTRDVTIGGGSLPAGVTADASLDIKGEIWTLAGSYRVAAAPGTSLDVFAGARMLELKEKFGWQFSADIGGIAPPPRTGDSNLKLSNVDGIVGAKGRYSFGSNNTWFVPYYVDVGTGDSDLTWQAAAGIGYSFSGGGEVFAVYRYLDYSFKNAKIENVNFGGPAVGVAFHW